MQNTPEILKKRKELMKTNARMTHVIQSQSLTDLDEYGHRTKEVRLFKPRVWMNRHELVQNFRDAMLFAIRRCQTQHIGTNVYSVIVLNGRPILDYPQKLAQVKWGHDNKLFIQYEGPTGHWFKRQAKL